MRRNQPKPQDGDVRWSVPCRWVLALGLCGLLFVNQYASLYRLLSWDEVEYVQAVWHCVIGNYLERGSLYAAQFVALGRAKAGRDPAAVGRLAASLPLEADSPSVLRHGHPPLLIYLLAPWTTESQDEGTRVQSAGAVIALLGVVGAWSRWGKGIGALGLIVLFSSPLGIHTLADSINFHTMLVLVLVLFLAVLRDSLRKPRGRAVLVVALCAALLPLALETGIFVLGLVVLTLTMFLAPWNSAEAAWTFVRRGSGYVICSLGLFWLLWPGSLRTAAPF